MHAMVLKQIGQPLEWTELPDPQPGPGRVGVVTATTTYPLEHANQALADLRAGRFEGAAVLVPTAVT